MALETWGLTFFDQFTLCNYVCAKCCNFMTSINKIFSYLLSMLKLSMYKDQDSTPPNPPAPQINVLNCD